MRQALKSTAQELFHRAGGLGLVRRKNRHAARILMYHRFRDAAPLEAQCVHLCQHYAPIALRELSEHLESGQAFPSNSVAITVDDGYRDFLDVAFPIFSRHRIPVTVFLVTDFLDGKAWLWPDVVKYAFERTALNNVQMELPNGRRFFFSLASPESRSRAARSTCEEAKNLVNPDRVWFVDRICKELEVVLPPKAPENDRPLGWDEVRSLARSGMEIGAHTKTHPILSRISDRRGLGDEIAGSKLRIEEELNQPVLHFCYPNGRSDDINEDVVAAVREASFRTAVTTESGLNSQRSDALRLRRIGVEPDYPDLFFHQCAAGFRV